MSFLNSDFQSFQRIKNCLLALESIFAKFNKLNPYQKKLQVLEEWLRLSERVPDLVVLDVLLSDGLGLDFCRKMRELYTTPVLFLSCRDEKPQIVEGLKSGGDDYMTKPYDMDELLARCDAMLRRVKLYASNQSDRIQVYSLLLDKLKQKAYLDGEDTCLTPKEFAMLLFFATHPAKNFTSEELYKEVSLLL